jgi:hypothetical protein
MTDRIVQYDPTRSRRANRRLAYMIDRHDEWHPRPVNKTERKAAQRANATSAYVLPEPWRPTRSKRRHRDAERPSPVTSMPASLPLTRCQQCVPDGALVAYCEPRLHGVGRRQLLITREDNEPKTLQVQPTRTGRPVPVKKKRELPYYPAIATPRYFRAKDKYAL